MTIRATIGDKVANQIRKFPCLKIDPCKNVLLFKDASTATIIFSLREQNIGTQYRSGEYNPDSLEDFTETLTLKNMKYIEDSPDAA
jgi:hypothetical protein